MSTLEELRAAFAGRYEIEADIGHGGSAWVFAARDVRHARRVALKVLKPELAASVGKERFLREIQVEAGLQHPHILALFDSGEIDDLPFFVMPFVAGGTLRARLEAQHRLEINDAVRIARQLCDALGYAHTRGFIHRDVKPENVLLDDGHALLADFGIARALWHATHDRVTATGLAVGTTAYMSPEQGLADDAAIDGRSDQYSLGCVLYEMLVGEPPHTAHNAMQMAARRAATPVASVRKTRSDVPVALDRAVLRALETDPAARWPDMTAFDHALGEATSTLTAGTLARATRRKVRRSAVAVAVAAALAVLVWRALTPSRAAIDPELLVVLPFVHGSPLVDSAFNGDDCSHLLRDAIAEWRGVRLVDDMRVRDVRRRLGRAPESLDEALRTAAALGAGLAVWGVVEPASGVELGTTVRLQLYDVRGREQKAAARATLEPEGDVLGTFAALADSLLTQSIGAVGERRLPATRDLESLRAYVRGHRALDRWNLTDASSAFAMAATLDSDNGLAHLWQAQSAAWIRDPDAMQWGQAAGRALRAQRGLSPRDSSRARALLAMSRSEYVAACDEYRALLQRDSLDFTGWFGLGECLTSDPSIEADSLSRSGWRFRTSINEALAAYQRAIDLVPTFPGAFGSAAFQRLARYSYVDVRRYRPGIRRSDSARFAALPELAGDTLVFIPFPERVVFAESAAAAPATYLAALERNKQRLGSITRAWAAADSLNPAALEALALALESSGELEVPRGMPNATELSALGAIRRARVLSDGDEAVRLTVHESRLLLKLDRLNEAVALADSVIGVWRTRSPSALTARWLRGLAILTGRGELALEWSRSATTAEPPDPTRVGVDIPPLVAVAGAEALVFAALGSAPESVRAAIARGDRALDDKLTRANELARQRHLEWPMTLAWPARAVASVWPTRPSAGNAQLYAQRALARNDSRAARLELERVEASAMRHRPSETGFDVVELTARLWMALGDTAAALRMLDGSLETIRDSGRQLVMYVAETAGYVRTMALRAELAGRRGDSQRARQLADRVRLLWGKGDVFVRPQLSALERWR